MNFYVGITDRNWFDYLRELRPEEVNFWRPMARTVFRAIEPGAPFLFKLHRPNDFIVGGGFFSGYTRVPLSMAWDAFGQNNGSRDYPSFKSSISTYRATRGLETHDPEIGCIVLSNPFFFEEADWIEPPSDWGSGIMQGKSYDDSIEEGKRIWDEVRLRIYGNTREQQPGVVREVSAGSGPVFGNKYLRTARLGQGAFRLMTLENYSRKCCITGETTVPVLEAAHIRPVGVEGDHSLTNGLLMRADMHILFDKGLIGIDQNYRIRVSSSIREQYFNGQVYYAHDGGPLRSLPSAEDLQPDLRALDWHMREVFVA